MQRMRMTYATAAVLQALDRGHRYGFDIAQAARLRRGTVYPILRRLEEAGIVESRWEEAALSHQEGRPPRKYYELTAEAGPLIERARDAYPQADPEAREAIAADLRGEP